MKRYFKKILVICLLTLALTLPSERANAGLYELFKAVATKVIKAIDLKIQRLQNKTIWLQNAQKELENTLSKLKLKEISDWSEKQRAQYDQYFKELWRIKNAISTWNKVKEIVSRQLVLVEEYRRAWNLLQRDSRFHPKELEHIYKVYSGILEESLKNIDQLMMVASSFKTQMTDGQRLEFIETISKRMESNISDLRRFSDRNFRISLSRARSEKEAALVSKMYGIK
jgi:hypothetical protein